MLVLNSSLLGLPIVLESTGQKAAEIKELIFDPDSGRLVGILVSTGTIFKKELVLAPVDIIKYFKNALIIRDSEVLVEPAEIVRVQKVLEKGPRLINLRAETAAGEFLGKISDLLIDTASNKIAKFYVHSLMKDRIIPLSRVIRVTQKAVVFDEDTKMGVKAPSALPVTD